MKAGGQRPYDGGWVQKRPHPPGRPLPRKYRPRLWAIYLGWALLSAAVVVILSVRGW